MTPTPRDLRDLAHRLVYLVGPLVGASDDDGDHGGMEERDGGATLLAWPELADGELAGGDIIMVGPTRPSASIALLGRPYYRR